MEGNFILATDLWSHNNTEGALPYGWTNAVTDFKTVDKVILVRDDVTVSALYDNLSFLHGNVIIDLCKNTLTSTVTLFNAQAKRSGSVNITVKNGTLLQGAKELVLYQSMASTSYIPETNGVRKFNFTFENVTLGYASGAAATPFVKNASSGSTPVEGSVVFDNCTFDLTKNAPSGTSYELMAAYKDSKKNISTSITVKGGVIKANTMGGVTVGAASGDNYFGFSKDANGKYTTVELPEGASAPSGVYIVDNIGCEFTAKSTEGGITTYEFAQASTWTPYGIIPESYANVDQYPFVRFAINADGTYTINYATDDIFSDGSQLMQKARTQDTVLFMRRDYTKTTSGSHTNLCHINATLIFDMGGHTLSIPSGTAYSANAKRNNYTTNLVFKNGTVVTKDGYFINFSSTFEAEGNSQVFNVTFDNMTFKLASGASAKYFVHTESGLRYYTTNVTYNDCVFNLENAPNAEFVLFDIGGKDGKATGAVTVNGGKLMNASKYKLVSANNGDSEVVFGNGSNGKYIILAVANAPVDEFTTVENYKAVFGKVGDTYTLVPNEFKIVGAYLNITENINVCYKVVLPADYDVQYMTFEFNGNTYKVIKYTTNADGSVVFKFVGVTPQMLGDNISATVYATYGGGTVTREKTEYSVKTYCVNMLNDADATLKTLLSDLLVYGAKSQLYAGYKTDALVTDGIDGLTPSTFTELTETKSGLVGEADTNIKWSSAALRYENAMAMKFFFTASDVTGLTVKVTVNGRETVFTANDFVIEKGKYVVYFRGIMATEYDDVVSASFYKDGVQIGNTATYSVNSYVFSKQNDTVTENLADLVCATYNYGVSASAYAGK